MKEYQQKLDEMMKRKGWHYWGELSILARLFEEGGEFSEAVNFLFGEKILDHGKKVPNDAEEIGDIIYTLACYANKRGLNLEECALASLAKVDSRNEDED